MRLAIGVLAAVVSRFGATDAFAPGAAGPRFGGATARIGTASSALGSQERPGTSLGMVGGDDGFDGEDDDVVARMVGGLVGDDDDGIDAVGEDGTDMGSLPSPKYDPKEGGDDEGQGGSMFKKMLEAAEARKSGGGAAARPMGGEQQAQAQEEGMYDATVEQRAQAPAAVPPPPPGVPLPPGWTSTVDPVSGRTYYYNQVTQETSWTPPPMPPPPPPQGGEPSRVVRSGVSGDPTDNDDTGLKIPTLKEQFKTNVRSGRRELDTISCKADVYLAQLKRDSTVRKIAQQLGDNEKANDVFGDSGIQELETWVQANPHTEDQVKSKWAFVGSSPDQDLNFLEGDGNDGMTAEERQAYSGVSYKEKMAQMKAAKKQKRKEEGDE